MAAYTTIDDPSAYFKVQLYTGDGAADHAITFDDTDTDMQPDLVWIKNRDATDSHCLFDSVRGVTKVLHTDTTDVEATDTDTLDAFQSDGFKVDADVKVNTDSEKYVAWCWKAGTTSGITSTSADIVPSAYSFNTTSKFGIAAYTGNGTNPAAIAHACAGGTVYPEFIYSKCRDFAGREGLIYHEQNTSAPETEHLELDQTSATQDTAWSWNDTAPTAVLLTVQSNAANNKSGTLYVLYSWRGVQGFSKFGKYIGNASTDGPFIYTGFRPAFVLIKRSSDGTNQWSLSDNKRGYNGAIGTLTPDSTEQEYTPADQIDHLSNGFKIRQSAAARNATGATYIYAAFAEAPFVNSNGVPCNAR